MKYRVVEHPDPDKVAELLAESKRRNACLMLFVQCEVEYDGRARSTLASGDRVVLCKPDGTVLVHTDDQREPQNWQPPGAAVEITTRDPLTIEAVRSNPEEVIRIRCSTVFFAALMRLDDTATLDLQGSEDDLRTHIFANPEVIKDGFRPEAKEYDTPAGPVDVWGYDADGQPVILELKRRRAGPAAVSQLRRYVESLDSDVRGILVAASLTARAEALLDDFGLESRTITPPTLSLSTNRSLDEFAPMGEQD